MKIVSEEAQLATLIIVHLLKELPEAYLQLVLVHDEALDHHLLISLGPFNGRLTKDLRSTRQASVAKLRQSSRSKPDPPMCFLKLYKARRCKNAECDIAGEDILPDPADAMQGHGAVDPCKPTRDRHK